MGDPADKARVSGDLDEYREDPERGADEVARDVEVSMREAEFMADDRDEAWDDYVAQVREAWDIPRRRIEPYRLKRPQLLGLVANETGRPPGEVRERLAEIEERVYGGAVTFGGDE